MTRLLLSTRRQVPLDQLDDYSACWQVVEGAVAAAGGRAWLFRGARHQDVFIEFVEWSSDDTSIPLPEQPEIVAARAELDELVGPGHDDEWEEAP